MSAYTFIVHGVPAPKGSRIPGQRKDGTIYTRPASKREKAWVEAVARATQAEPRRLAAPPYLVELSFWMPRPKKPSHGHPTRGDLDKISRATIDGLVLGGALIDDRHVTELRARKDWAPEPGAEGVMVRIAEIEEDPGPALVESGLSRSQEEA